jgi:hypothetical protein
MNATEFFAAYDGKGVDFDGYYGDQCVDLAQFYERDVIGGPPFTGNACDIWTTYPQSYYTEVTNTPTNVPILGDVLIWSGALNGGYGHIAIFSRGDALDFMSFDQNWPEGSPCHFQEHDYSYVLGWLHPIGWHWNLHTAAALKALPDHGPHVVAQLAAGTTVTGTGQTTPHWTEVQIGAVTGWLLTDNLIPA